MQKNPAGNLSPVGVKFFFNSSARSVRSVVNYLFANHKNFTVHSAAGGSHLKKSLPPPQNLFRKRFGAVEVGDGFDHALGVDGDGAVGLVGVDEVGG